MVIVLKLCADCAERLGSTYDPIVPELIEGRCPQCGSSRALIVEQPAALFEFPGLVDEPAAAPQADNTTGREAA